MSEFLAEARILVRPDTTAFRGLLEAELRASLAKPVTVPVVPVIAGGLASATAQTSAFTSAQVGAAAATQGVAAALEKETIAATQATAATTAHARSTSQLTRGAAASGLSLFGLRGATLAASGAFLAGTAAVVGFAKSLQSAADLETELNVFRVTAGATADEMDRVAASAKQLGRDITLPGVTAGSAATAMTELAKAGLSVEDSLAGARGALQLATAAQIDVKDSTNLVAGALNAFELAGTDAVKVADLLTGAAKSSQGEITDMGTALSQAAAVSNLFGVSIEDTVTLLTQLAKAGISGGRAGTSLRVAFLRLVNPPAAAAKALKALNVEVQDLATGGLNVNIFTDIQRSLQGYTKEQQRATLATIFGADAIRAAGIIGAQGEISFDKLRVAVTAAGLANEAAGARTQGLQGDFENLQNQIGALGLVVGQLATGPVSELVTFLANVASRANEAADAIAHFKKVSAEKFDFNLPGTDDTGTDLGSKILEAILKTPPQLQAKLSQELASKVTDIVKDARDTVRSEKAIADLAQGGGVFGVGFLRGGVGPLGRVFDALTASALQLENALKKAAAARIQLLDQKQGLNVTQIQNIVGGFDAQQVRAKISGNNEALLDSFNTEQDFLEAQLRRDYVKRRPALRTLIENALLGTVNDIKSVSHEATREAERLKQEQKQKAADAAQLVRDQEQNLLARFGLARDQQQNLVAEAALTSGLKDDVKRQQELRQIVLDQIAVINERVTLEGGRAVAIAALRSILTQIKGSLKGLANEQQEAQREQRANLLQGAQLDVDLAQIRGNEAAEVKARKAVIVRLKAEQALVKSGTVEWKKLRNDIAAQNAAIAELNKEKQKGQSFAQATFDFLQTQQGFASNLLGNLIPTGATTGLVGGGSVQGALTPVAGAADARSQSGVTSGQGNATNSLLARILQQLVELNGDQAAPEANRQYWLQKATMDY